MGDVVVLKELNPEDGRLELTRQGSFALGVVRLEETYHILRRARRLLRRTQSPNLALAQEIFDVQASVVGMKADHDIQFNFLPDEFLRHRMNVLIGRNGVGKSRVLLSIIQGLTEEEFRDSEIYPARFSPRPHFNRLILFCSVARHGFPTRIEPWKNVDYAFVPLASEEPDADGYNPITASLVDIHRAKTMYKSIEHENEHVTARELFGQLLDRV